MSQFIKPNWPAPKTVQAYTTLKSGWNGKMSDTHQLKTLLALPDEPIWLQQKHTNIAVEATLENKNQIADASFTHQAERVCVVLTADCLPLLICNREGTKVAAIHAGWRGLANGVIESTLKALHQPMDDLLVWLGPAISQANYEVGKEVYDAFLSQHPEAVAAFKPKSQEKWLADLYALAILRLKSQGISHIFGGDFCTYEQQDLFFSYRRERGLIGRMASIIWLS